MIDPLSSRYWYAACRIVKEQSEMLFKAVEDFGESHRIAIAGHRVHYSTLEDYIIIMALWDIQDAIKSKLFEVLSIGRLCAVPEALLWQIHTRNREKATEYGWHSELFAHTEKYENLAETCLHLTPSFRQSLQKLPFIVAYIRYNEQAYKGEWRSLAFRTRDVAPLMHILPEHVSFRIAEIINKLNARRIATSSKYQFTQSALEMLERLEPYHTQPLYFTTGSQIWMEFETGLATPFGLIRAILIQDSYPTREIAHVSNTNSIMRCTLESGYLPHKGRFSLEIIEENTYELRHDFVWSAKEGWIFLSSYVCPFGACKKDPLTDENEAVYYVQPGFIHPCARCIEACAYYQRKAATMLAMIAGDYALSPDRPVFRYGTPIKYGDTKQVVVGHGKNRREVSQVFQNQLAYRLIAYDVSMKRTLSEDEEQEVRKARGSWLAAHHETEIIWKSTTFKAVSRKYPVRGDGTRKEGLVSVSEHVRMVPHVVGMRILKVVATHCDTNAFTE